MRPAEMHGGHAAVSALEAAHVDTVFGIPASHVIEVYDALRTSGIRTIVGRNEQACAYSADGYARRAKAPGVTVVTGGPGLGNIIAGLQTAWSDSSPLVAITSDLSADHRSAGRRGLPHETFDSAGLAAATGATLATADRPGEIYGAVRDALDASMAPRHGPAVALLARDALEAPWSGVVPAAKPISGPTETSADVVTSVAEALRAARAPVLIAGQGVIWSGAERALADVLERAAMPAVTTSPAVEAVPDSSRWWGGPIGDAAARALIEDADLVLAVGTSLGAASTSEWTLTLPSVLIHVDIDAEEFGRNYQPTMAVHSDAGAFLERLAEAIGDPIARACWTTPRRPAHPWVSAFDEALPAGPTTVVGDVSTTLRWLVRSVRTSPQRRLLMPWNSMGMGWSYAAAIGAQAAAPADTVVAVMGDGGALFSLGELATAAEHELPVCLVVFNNHSYGVISELQDALFDGAQFGVKLATPSFTSVADAFGVQSWRADSPGELHRALGDAFATGAPSLVEVAIDLADFGNHRVVSS